MTQLELLNPCRVPKRGTDCYQILMAMQEGIRVNDWIAHTKLGVYALSQRIGDLRRRYGWGNAIKDQFIESAGGKRVKEYWL